MDIHREVREVSEAGEVVQEGIRLSQTTQELVLTNVDRLSQLQPESVGYD